jgi:hypothetical protein
MQIIQSAKLKSNSLNQLLAIGGLAIGAVATISAAPAGAVTFGSGQQLGFGGFTTDFYPPASSGTAFPVTFSGNGSAETAGAPAGTQLDALFSPVTNINLTQPATGTFTYVSGSGNNIVYELSGNMTFAFANSIDFTVGSGSRFESTYNNGNQGIQLALSSDAGSFFTDRRGGIADITPALTSTFTFSDVPQVISGNFAGRYDIIASTTAAVPEPFTVIGTIVGGTAAFRMRKKLAAANKK